MERKNNYFLGIIGALLGGLIATIPWILCYVYANMIYSVLALFVAIAALKGYELFKGKVDKKLPYIIAIVSIIAITIATLVIIPNLLILKDFGTMSLANFKLLYQTSEFTSALIGDYVISLLFTILGMSSVITSIKKQVNNGSEKIDLKYEEKLISDERFEEIKKVFVDYSAISKDTALEKDKIFNKKEINETELNYLISKGYIRKVKNKYYYVLDNDKKSKKRNKIIYIILFIIILLGIIVGIVTSTSEKEEAKLDTTLNREVVYTIPEDYQEYENENNGWYYVPKKDLSGYSGFVDIALFDDGEVIEDYDTLKNNMKAVIEEEYEVKRMDDFENNKGNKVLVYVLEFEDYTETIYYIFKDTKYAVVDEIDYNVKNIDINKVATDIVNNFDWNE